MRPHALPLLVLFLVPYVASAETQRDPVASASAALDALDEMTRVRPGVVVTLTVVTHGRSAAEASERNAIRMVGLLTALRRQPGGASTVIPTGQVVTREDEWDGDGRAPRDSLIATEYAARHGVRVTLHDLASLGPMLDTALASGATGISGIALAPPAGLSERRRGAELALRTARDDLVATVAPSEGRLRRLLELGLIVRALSCR